MAEKSGARVFVVEDDKTFAELIGVLLGCGGHKVVGEAFWPSVAMNETPNLKSLGVQVVTVDNDLFGGSMEDTDFVKKVNALGIYTIGLSVMPVPGVTYDLTKERICDLNAVIDQLLGYSS